jgi:EAL domain-containing protein (putative c-di-GMP-specific phosphodiesterase class I)
MQTVAQDRLELAMDLNDALDADQFFLLYQPTFDLQTATITGIEALLRWNHPTLGVLLPDAFLPLAEQTGLIVPIGRWVLQTACEQAVSWRRDGHHSGSRSTYPQFNSTNPTWSRTSPTRSKAAASSRPH